LDGMNRIDRMMVRRGAHSEHGLLAGALRTGRNVEEASSLFTLVASPDAAGCRVYERRSLPTLWLRLCWQAVVQTNHIPQFQFAFSSPCRPVSVVQMGFFLYHGGTENCELSCRAKAASLENRGHVRAVPGATTCTQISKKRKTPWFPQIMGNQGVISFGSP
jgi:hypothetical protein